MNASALTSEPTAANTTVAPQTLLRVAGYARVSTDLQRERETIQTQVELIQSFAQSRGYHLTEIYCDDGVSGTIPLHERPAGSKLLADARAGGFSAVVVYKADRIGRDVLANEAAVRDLHDGLGITFLGVAETIDLASPLGRTMFTFQSAISRLERENTLQRSKDATLRLAREGVWLGGMVPYGYRVEGVDRAARLRISDEPIPGFELSEADVVRMVYLWSGEEGLSSIQIAQKLNLLGVPPVYVRDGRKVASGKRKTGTAGVWRAGRVRNMLVESTYKGLHIWGKRSKRSKNGNSGSSAGKGQAKEQVLVERAVPAIVDEKLWQKAQHTLHLNRLTRPDIPKRPYLLRGLMKCAHCGLTYIGTVSGGAKAETLTPQELTKVEVRGGVVLRPYYMCNGKNAMHQIYGQTGQRCISGYLRAETVEELVWRDIEVFLQKPGEVLEKLRETILERFAGVGEKEKQLQRLQKDIESKAEQRALLFRLFRRGGMSESDLERQLNEMAGEEEALQRECEGLERELESGKDATRCLESAQALLQTLREKLDGDGELAWDTRRRIVEALVAGIEVECQFDPTAKRGRQRQTTLHITYSFEAPGEVEMAQARPRTGKSPKRLPGLCLRQTHQA